MSLIGIDLGTSAIKAAAYTLDGRQLAAATCNVPAYRPEPGHWEVNVVESRAAFTVALTAVAGDPAVRADPPVAISFSSSGREVFPVSAQGEPLGPCLMTSDVRGDDVAAVTASRRSPEAWFRLTGHVPRRMDPINRALWWRLNHPVVTRKARWFMNWHEFYSLLLSGRPVVDASNAGTWATYDVSTGNWSQALIAETGIDPSWLSEVMPNAEPIGQLLPEAAARFGLPKDVLIVTGAYDTFAAAVGSAAVDPGIVSLACGTWNSFNMPVKTGWPEAMVHDGVSVFPHPGPTGFGISVTNPNGMSVINWARELTDLSIVDLESGLAAMDPGPGHVFADAAFTPLPHVAAAEGFGGIFDGVTLASTRFDIVKALFEAIAVEFSLSLETLRRRGVPSNLVRATGGGARSAWFMQLTSDISGLPVEVVDQDEPGAFGAAILAGVGAELYASVSEATASLVRVKRRYEPDRIRGDRYAGVRQRIARGDQRGSAI